MTADLTNQSRQPKSGRPIPKTLQELTLFSKYLGVRKAKDTLDINRTMYGQNISNEDAKARLASLDEILGYVSDDLSNVVEEHLSVFKEFSSPFLDADQQPTAEMRKASLSIIYMTGGDVANTLIFLNDLFKALREEISVSDSVQLSLSYLKFLTSSGYLVPSLMDLDEEGNEVVVEEMDELETTVSIGQMRLFLSEQAEKEIIDVIDVVDEGRAEVIEAFTAEASLMTMDSPSKMLN